MSKSLNARCIRRWEVRVQNLSVIQKESAPDWRKRDARCIRETLTTTAYSMVESMAERNAKVDYDGRRRTDGRQNFSAWYQGDAMNGT